jgi:hypothetical protein
MLAALLWIGAMAGCAGSDEATSETAVAGPDDVDLGGGQSELSIVITGGSAPGWELGILYSDHVEYSCHDAGDTCFPLDADGGTVDWCEGDDDTDCADLSAAAYVVGYFSFVLKPSVGLGCWSWGSDADYWDDLGCTQMDWSDNP